MHCAGLPARGRAAVGCVARGLVAWAAFAPVGAALVALAGCERGCARDWLADRGVGAPSPSAAGPMPLNAMDCPDGLARCEDGVVSVSKLATVALPCRGSANACACPWEPAGECGAGCAADGVELVIERTRATSQLCAPGRDAGTFATPLLPTPDVTGEPNGTDNACDEGDRYRCAAGRVFDCASGRAAARCLRGCFVEGSSIDDDDVSREAAFAILCSR